MSRGLRVPALISRQKLRGTLMKKLKGVAIGAGYFSRFHFEAWWRIPEVELVAFSDLDARRVQSIKSSVSPAQGYTDYREMFDSEKPDFVDVITPPCSHREICAEAAGR